jgi:hypothetical protein
LVVVVVVEVALPAGVSTVVDLVVSVAVLPGGGDTLTVVFEGVESAGFSFTTVVDVVEPDDPVGVTSALQPAIAIAIATSAARA